MVPELSFAFVSGAKAFALYRFTVHKLFVGRRLSTYDMVPIALLRTRSEQRKTDRHPIASVTIPNRPPPHCHPQSSRAPETTKPVKSCRTQTERTSLESVTGCVSTCGRKKTIFPQCSRAKISNPHPIGVPSFTLRIGPSYCRRRVAIRWSLSNGFAKLIGIHFMHSCGERDTTNTTRRI